MPTDKKISELPIATSISASDISILVDSGTDYQYTFTVLLQFLEANLTTGAGISFGTVLPQNTAGSDGDVFVNISVGSFAQKLSGTWTIVYSLPAANAADGTLLYGTGLPGTTTGKNADSYINTLTGIFYQKTAGAWSQVFSMATGPQGPQGIAGTNGTNGVNGNTILYGIVAPSNTSTGVDDNFYINTSNYTIFGPKAAGAWPSGVSIIGNDGPVGPTGLQGEQGIKGEGIATGGTTGQVLAKNSNIDYDAGWINPPSGGGGSIPYAIASGTNTYEATIPGLLAYTSPSQFFIFFENANTDAATLNINSLGNREIVKNGLSPLIPNDIPSGQTLCLAIDNSSFQIVNLQPEQLPSVTTGEKILSVKSTGVQANYDAIDQVVPATSLTSADFSTGIASVSGQTGQLSYDTNYRYECVTTNQWIRQVINNSIVDMYLVDIDDSTGDKTSVQLQTSYPTSSPGQQVFGINKLYIKKTSTGWKKISIADA